MFAGHFEYDHVFPWGRMANLESCDFLGGATLLTDLVRFPEDRLGFPTMVASTIRRNVTHSRFAGVVRLPTHSIDLRACDFTRTSRLEFYTYDDQPGVELIDAFYDERTKWSPRKSDRQFVEAHFRRQPPA